MDGLRAARARAVARPTAPAPMTWTFWLAESSWEGGGKGQLTTCAKSAGRAVVEEKSLLPPSRSHAVLISARLTVGGNMFFWEVIH